MKTLNKLFAMLVLTLFSGGVLAESKIVVLDLQEAMLNTQLAQQRIAALDRSPEVSALRARLESLEADIRALGDTAEKESMTWSETERDENRRRMESLRSDYESAATRLQREGQAVLQRVAQELTPKTRTVLEQLIAAENIGMVLSSQAVYHATAAYDITERVTALLDKAD